MLVKLSPYLIALTIGLIIGVERERHALNGQQPMGVRSFLLFSLLGAITGSVGQPLVAFGLALFAVAATLVGYLRTTRLPDQSLQPVGLTTEIAALSTFCLGYYCNMEPLLSLTLGVLIFLVLFNKTFLHTWTKERLKTNELQAAATLVLLMTGVIPILPNVAIDPLQIFNPRRLAVIISLIAAIQFSGYAATRILGPRMGIALSGFLAGNISSTAAFVTYAKLASSRPHSAHAFASAAAFALVATLCQLFFLLIIASWPVALALALPLTIMITLSTGTGIFLWSKKTTSADKENFGDPLNIMSAIKLGILFTALLFIVELSERFAGQILTQVVAFVGALFKVQGVAVAAANMFENHTVTLNAAANTVMLALIASLLSKLVLTVMLAKGSYRTVTLLFTSVLFSLSIGFWFLIRFLPSFFIPS